VLLIRDSQLVARPAEFLRAFNAGSSTLIDIVVCTYNNAVSLERILCGLATQTAANGEWSVLVVDNNCTDHTREVVDLFITGARIPNLRIVSETVQGLTPARLRGVRETTAPWIAFVDDDCLLEAGWIRAAIAFARTHSEAAAFGGRVVPDWGTPPTPLLQRYSWCFASQDHGPRPCPTRFLVGAGIVISRAALVEAGWTSRQYLDDRVGRRLISGGDVEISLRLGSTGRQLWFTPDCLIWHLIPPQRTTVRSLAAMNRGLGTSQVLTDAMKVSAKGWFGALFRQVMAEWARLPTAAMRAFRGYPSGLSCLHGPTAIDLMLCTCFLWGKIEGLACLERMRLAGGPPFIGCAWPRSEPPPE
jgi:glucosyl-dolichyl phosphate glucuronosyltransferase